MRARAWVMANTRQAEMQDSEERNEQFAFTRIANPVGLHFYLPFFFKLFKPAAIFCFLLFEFVFNLLFRFDV